MVTILLLSILYVQIGYQLSKQGWKAWKRKEQSSVRSLLFFPVHRTRRLVGKTGFFATRRDDEIMYKAYMTLGWPLDMAWNLASLAAFVGPDMAISRLLKGKEPPALKRGRLVREIEQLEADAEREFDERLTEAVAAAKRPLPAKRATKPGKAGKTMKKKLQRAAQAPARALPEGPRLRVVPEPQEPANGNDDEEPVSAPRMVSGHRSHD